MRYFSFNEFDGESEWVSTLSEDDIRRDYFPYWQKRMIDKFGEEYYNATYSFEDCLNDWIVGNWAWEVYPDYTKDKIIQALAVPQGEGEPSRLSYDEIIEIHNKYSIVGIIETYREIEMAVLKKNGFEPKTIQFDWDYLDSLLKGDK